MSVFRFVLVLSLVFLSSNVWSQQKESTIQKVLEVSGIKAQMDGIPEMVGGMLSQQSRAFGSEQYAKISAIMLRSFSAVNFYTYQIQELGANYNEELCAKILNDYTSRVLLEITDVENKALGKVSEDMAASFDYSTIDPERDAVISDLIASTRLVEISTTMSVGGIHTLVATMNLFLPEGRKLTADQENSIIEQATAPLRSDEYFDHLKRRMALIYQGISTDDLRFYVGFYRSPEGTYLYDSYVSALKKAFANCMKNAAGELTREFKLPGDQA